MFCCATSSNDLKILRFDHMHNALVQKDTEGDAKFVATSKACDCGCISSALRLPSGTTLERVTPMTSTKLLEQPLVLVDRSAWKSTCLA